MIINYFNNYNDLNDLNTNFIKFYFILYNYEKKFYIITSFRIIKIINNKPTFRNIYMTCGNNYIIFIIYCKSKNKDLFIFLSFSFSSIFISFFLNFIFINSLFLFCKLSIL